VEASYPQVVRSSVCTLFAGLLPNFNTICRKWINQFWCKLAQVVSGARAWNLQLWESGGQTSRSYEAKVGNKNPFWQSFSRTIWQIFTKPVRHICHNNSDAKGESHKKPKIDLEAWWRHHFGPFGSNSFSGWGYNHSCRWVWCKHLSEIVVWCKLFETSNSYISVHLCRYLPMFVHVEIP